MDSGEDTLTIDPSNCILLKNENLRICFGILFQLIFQTIMNLFVVIGLIPVTGVTLPFISYGGSSLLISMVSMGIILNISRFN